MKQFLLSAILALTAVTVGAQDAFYIYQNDGHFDGFFYDEVQKISYSKIDTLGFEHEDYVSQEIITADSVYRIMLTAIDSVGFVQPETILNPHVYISGQNSPYGDFDLLMHVDYGDEEIISFSSYIDEYDWIPAPQVGDVFVDPDIEYGWSAKIKNLTRNYPGYEGQLVAICKPIDDISDIFQQFIAVEEYGYDNKGNLSSRRVSGRPDLEIRKNPKASYGEFSGDIFDFTLSTHFPIWSGNGEDLNITVDANIEGRLHVKTAWNLPLIGSKYISVTSTLYTGVSAGFTIDGKISDFFPTGIGKYGLVPIPAACPLLVIDVGPDCFIRGEAHVKMSAMSPKIGGSIWQKWEIIDWWPYFDMGFGKLDEENNSYVDKSSSGAKLEFSGFVQAGMLFPLKLKNLPLLDKVFKAELGGQWYVGPKITASVSADLTDYQTLLQSISFVPIPQLIKAGNQTYNLLRNTKFTLGLLDADYEIKANVSSLFSKKKEWTVADGTLHVLPSTEVALAPDFGDCVEYTEKRNIFGEDLTCRVFAFEPKDNVLMPVTIGVQNFYSENEYPDTYPRESKYYQTEKWSKKYNQHNWAEYVLPYRPTTKDNPTPEISRGKCKLHPYVNFLGMDITAPKEYEFIHGVFMESSGDTLILDCDGTPLEPIVITGNCDDIKPPYYYLSGHEDSFDDFIKVTGSKGHHEISVDTEKFLERDGMNYSPVDTIEFYLTHIPYRGFGTIEGQLFATDQRYFRIWTMPNKKMDPKSFDVRVYSGFGKESIDMTIENDLITRTVTRLEEGNGWHCELKYHHEEGNQLNDLTMEFDYLVTTEPKLWTGGNHPTLVKQNGHCTCVDSNGDHKKTLTFSFEGYGNPKDVEATLKIEDKEQGTEVYNGTMNYFSVKISF